MAFRKKAEFILCHKPDILIVQECEHPSKLKFPKNIPEPTDVVWFGKNQNKGLGVFSYSAFRFKVHQKLNEGIRLVIPIEATDGQSVFNIFAIWANNPAEPKQQYIEQVWKAIHEYSHLITKTNTILMGDFNSNKIWDRQHRAGNHSNVVKILEEKGIKSAYHAHHNQAQGAEQDATFYLYRHQNKPYHLDYCFLSSDLLANLKSVEIGDFEAWKTHSDHMPIIVSF
jgi:exodeoxyribonuclease III